MDRFCIRRRRPILRPLRGNNKLRVDCRPFFRPALCPITNHHARSRGQSVTAPLRSHIGSRSPRRTRASGHMYSAIECLGPCLVSLHMPSSMFGRFGFDFDYILMFMMSVAVCMLSFTVWRMQAVAGSAGASAGAVVARAAASGDSATAVVEASTAGIVADDRAAAAATAAVDSVDRVPAQPPAPAERARCADRGHIYKNVGSNGHYNRRTCMGCGLAERQKVGEAPWIVVRTGSTGTAEE